jgi:signal transduction histidine kinase
MPAKTERRPRRASPPHDLSAERQADQLAMLNEVGRAVATQQDLASILEMAYQHVQRCVPTDAFYVALLHNPATEEVSFPLLYDEGRRWFEPPMQLDPQSWVAQVLHSGAPLCLNRKAEELGKYPVGRAVGDIFKEPVSIMVVPLRCGERLIGAVSAQSYNLNAYTDDHLELLIGLSYPIAIAIEHARLNDALQAELAERKHAEAEVRQLNAELEQRVAERTAALEAANRDLESFSYSISHDLRAPLRGIHGYAHFLAEDFGDQLPAPAQDYLQKVLASATQMSALIDALLAFSRLGRQALRRSPTPLGELARQALVELLAATPDPAAAEARLQVQIADLPTCSVDPALFHQVFVNLLSNALKFTRQRQVARIEVGCQQQGDEMVYFVRDNGAGFDMAFAGKLFGVFERLHRPEEFEGVGVGLANVKRIIERHGGRIWAEGEVDEGATFYFAIGA